MRGSGLVSVRTQFNPPGRLVTAFDPDRGRIMISGLARYGWAPEVWRPTWYGAVLGGRHLLTLPTDVEMDYRFYVMLSRAYWWPVHMVPVLERRFRYHLAFDLVVLFGCEFENAERLTWRAIGRAIWQRIQKGAR